MKFVLTMAALGLLCILVVVALAFSTRRYPDARSTEASDSVQTLNHANDVLRSSSTVSQSRALAVAVGEGCIGQRAFYDGMDDQADAFWSVGCSNGSDYMVQIKPDGSTKVLECSMMKAIGTNCFATFHQLSR